MFKVSVCLPTKLIHCFLCPITSSLILSPFGAIWSKDLRGVPGCKVLALLHSLGIKKSLLSGFLQSDLLTGPRLSLRKTLWSLSLSSPGDLPSGSLQPAFQPPSG